MTPMESALEVLHEYYKAFSSLELNAIVSHFCEPCMSIGPEGVFSAATRPELANAFAPFIETLRAKGYGRSEFAEAQVTMLSESVAFVRGLAVRYMADGREMERVQISYLMHRAETGWKIAVMVLPR
jgi:ketosteroid isomerase-like protein